MSNRYALIDAEGLVVNVVVWDGEKPVNFGDGLTAVLLTPSDNEEQNEHQ